MDFSSDKCKVLQCSVLNQGRTYTINGGALESAANQMDLGLKVHGSLKVLSDGQCD